VLKKDAKTVWVVFPDCLFSIFVLFLEVVEIT